MGTLRQNYRLPPRTTICAFGTKLRKMALSRLGHDKTFKKQGYQVATRWHLPFPSAGWTRLTGHERYGEEPKGQQWTCPRGSILYYQVVTLAIPVDNSRDKSPHWKLEKTRCGSDRETTLGEH